jgi:tight adherence protein B
MPALSELASALLGAGPGLPLIVAGFVLGLFLLLVIAMSDGDGRARRDRIARLKGGERRRSRQSNVSLRRSTADSSIVAIDQLIKRYLPNVAKLRSRLARTGYKITIGQYLSASAAVLVLSAGALMLALSLSPTLSVLAGLGLGLGLPHAVVGYLGKRRLARFNNQFPEAIDLIIRGLKSGLPVTESIKAVGQEVPKPVGEEFGLVSDSIRFGSTLSEALWQAATRVDTPEFRFFNISLSIQQETGGNLAETLENLSNVLRRRRQMHLKIKALSSEAKASAYIIGSLPFVMWGIIYMMNSTYALQLFQDPRGLMMVGAAAVSYFIGIFVMWKMVRFEI